MTPKIENWNIVLAGQWNVRVFSPAWVARHLFDDKPIKFEVVFGADGLSTRHIDSDIIITPFSDKIVIGVKRITDEVLLRAEKIAILILDLLPHTPVNALGVNFGFNIEQPPSSIFDLFKLNDLNSLSENGCEIVQSEVLRKIKMSKSLLNLNLRFSWIDSEFKAFLNFHEDVDLNSKAAIHLKDHVLKCKQSGIDLLKSVYGLEVDVQEN